MKTIKLKLIALFIFASSCALFAQEKEYKITTQNTKEGRLILKDFSYSLPIEGYNGTDIIITTSSEDFAPPEKAKGLKPIFPAGTDNTGIGLDVQKIDNLITVTCLLSFNRNGEYKIRVPESMAIELSSGCERNNNISIKGMKNEIDIKCCHNITLADVTGPLVLSTISGDINITYSSINTTKSSSVNSISGDIDVTLPSKTATDLELRTVTGAFYSDFDFSQTQKNLKKYGGNEMNYSLNGGGFKFTIGSISGNIYLRKGN
jgi:lia operon protein LiaG